MNRGLSPAAVAFLRGLAEAAVLAVLGVIVTAVSAVTTGELAPYVPAAVLALRQLEGIIDQRIDPTKQRATGGAPVNR